MSSKFEETEEFVDVNKMEDEDKEKKPSTSNLRGAGRKKKIIREEDLKGDPEEIKAKKKKKEIEYKLNKLKTTLTTDNQRVCGKRQKKAPERLELAPIKPSSRKVTIPDGRGMPLGNIRWTSHQLGKTSLSTLRLLHRTMFRKQGNFIEKHIIKDVWKFRGFDFGLNDKQMNYRRQNLDKQKLGQLQSLCFLLGLSGRGGKEEIIHRIITFLLCPSERLMEKKFVEAVIKDPSPHKNGGNNANKGDFKGSLQFALNPNLNNADSIKNLVSSYTPGSTAANVPWKRPAFFEEGNGVKLKYIRQVAANIEMANDNFIDLLHRLLYLRIDEIGNMRQNILEFSGLKCLPTSEYYICRTKMLALIPADQVKLICRILALPTWHKSRQFLAEGIMDFLAAPRISAMKKKVPPHFTDEISFSFEREKNPKPIVETMNNEECETIEVFPDIHILPDDEEDAPYENCDSSSCVTNEYLGVKLKNFANIYYQVIHSSAIKLYDVHMIMYLTTTTPSNVRNNVLEFAGFPFDESSKEYFCRKSFMNQMSLEELRHVASVLCVSQCIVDDSKASLIDAILKFLVKPSALLNSSTMMPTPSIPQWGGPISIQQATSTSYTPPQQNEMFPEILISEVKTLAKMPTDSPKNVISSTISAYAQSYELERMKACFSSDIEIMPVASIKTENTYDEDMPTSEVFPVPQSSVEDTDVPLSKVKNTVTMVPAPVAYIDSDDEDDKPLSRLVGHPNDEQLKSLVTKIVRESKLEDITMKIVIKKVFDNYPNFDLGYRKEFVKSIVRQILSQMEDQSRVSTTVINI